MQQCDDGKTIYQVRNITKKVGTSHLLMKKVILVYFSKILPKIGTKLLMSVFINFWKTKFDSTGIVYSTNQGNMEQNQGKMDQH